MRIGRRKLRSFSGSSLRVLRSPRSIPEENIAPSPRTTTQRTDVVGRGLLQRRAQREDQLAVHRVALLGAVQDHVAHRSAVLGGDYGHVDRLPALDDQKVEATLVQIKKVGVLGAGLMGHGIAQVAAQSGYEVVLREVDDDKLEKGIGRIDKQLARAVEKGRAEQSDADAVKERIHGTVDYGDLADCDLVIEAITEDLALKLEMWREVDGIVKPEAVFATNTSSLPVIDQAASTSRPDRFLGLHYFNPAQVMKLVEVVRAVTTSDETFEVGVEFAKANGKLGIPTKDKAGFIVNRLLVPYMLDAMRAFEEGVGTVSEIDEAMKAGAGHPMGPLTLADFVGLDTMGSICGVMYQEFAERRFAQPPTLRKMLAAGWYGKKTGMGFYDYSGDAPVENPGLG